MAAPTYVATGTLASGSGGTINPGLPTGLQANDIMLLFVFLPDNNTVDIPSGWAHVTNSPAVHNSAASFGTVQLAVLWKRATGSDSAPSVSDSGPASLGIIAARISAFRGVVTSGNPWDATGKDTNDAVNADPSITGITTTVAETLVVVVNAATCDASSSYSSWTNANLTSFTERFDSNFNSGINILGMATGTKTTAGAIGTTTINITDPAWNVSMVIALKPNANVSMSAGATSATNVSNAAKGSVGARPLVIG